MSESTSAIQIFSYVVSIIPSAYFLYKILKEVYYHFTKPSDEDIL